MILPANMSGAEKREKMVRAPHAHRTLLRPACCGGDGSFRGWHFGGVLAARWDCRPLLHPNPNPPQQNAPPSSLRPPPSQHHQAVMEAAISSSLSHPNVVQVGGCVAKPPSARSGCTPVNNCCHPPAQPFLHAQPFSASLPPCNSQPTPTNTHPHHPHHPSIHPDVHLCHPPGCRHDSPQLRQQ